MLDMQTQQIATDLLRDLDKQLTRLKAVAHVVWGRDGMPALAAISRDLSQPQPLNHPPIESFVQAELIAARLNTLQGVGDRQRISILQSMQSKKGAAHAEK